MFLSHVILYAYGVQLGGADQLGNITTGYQLLQKFDNTKPAIGILTPLITSDSGAKFGKTEGAAVWLNRSKFSPFDFYQFFMRIHDTKIHEMLKLLSFFPDDEIEIMMQRFLKKTSSRLAQEKLAEQMTLLVHGEDGLSLAKRTSTVLYKENLDAISSLSYDEMKEVFGPSAQLISLYYEDPEDVDEDETRVKSDGMSILQLAMKSKCFENISDAARIISAGGFYINYKQVRDPSEKVSASDHILPNDISLIRVGKKRYVIVKWR